MYQPRQPFLVFVYPGSICGHSSVTHLSFQTAVTLENCNVNLVFQHHCLWCKSQLKSCMTKTALSQSTGHFVHHPGAFEWIGAISVGPGASLRSLPVVRPRRHGADLGAPRFEGLQGGGLSPRSLACCHGASGTFPLWLQRLADLQQMLLGFPCGHWRLDERLGCTSEACSRSCKASGKDSGGR